MIGPHLRLRATAVLGAGAIVALSVTGCSSGDSDSGKPTIVTSTNVWGSVAEAIAGPDAEVKSIIADPSADPHSYESSPADAAAVTDADLVVYNGGGYDEFVEKILDSKRGKPAVQAFELRGNKNDSNEHVWYDMATVGAVADRIAAQLGSADSVHSAQYTQRAKDFRDRLNSVSQISAGVAAAHRGAAITQTEPIAHYLLIAAGSDDRTPAEFEEAIEQGTDPSPSAVAATRDLLTGKQVRALIYNAQTEDKLTQDIRGTAEKAGVPVVEVTETLPEGIDFVQWQTRNANNLSAALTR